MRRMPGYFVILSIVTLLIGFQPFPSTLVAGAEKPAQESCPNGYRLVPAVEHPRADDNRNGWICMGRVEKGGKNQVVFVDDRIREKRTGKCPDDFRIASARENPETDRNRNGWICKKIIENKGKPHANFVDDKV